jgi:NHL repeat
VIDARHARMQIFDDKGEILISIGSAYSQRQGEAVAAGGFLLPQGVFIDAQDRIYVADMANHRVQLFQYMNEAELLKFRVSKEKSDAVNLPVK